MPFATLGHRQAALGFILVTAALDIVALGIIIPVLPVLIEQFVGSNAQAGVLNGVFVAPGLGFMIAAGVLAAAGLLGWRVERAAQAA